MAVLLAALVSARGPLNMMIFLDSSESKFIPMILTIEPTTPLSGLKLVMKGVGITMKLVALVTVTPLVVTDIFPVDAPAGTLAVILVVVTSVIFVEDTPLNLTTLTELVLKSVPVMVTNAPTALLPGLNPVIVGVGRTVNGVVVVIVTPLVVTVISPVVAPAGTVTVMLVEVDDTTVAFVLLNLTMLLAGVVLKLVPVIITVADIAPL